MNKQLQRLIELSSKTGDRLIVFDLNKENSPYVVMGVDDYERMAIGMSEVRGLTEDELLDKINRDIAIWQSDRIDNEGQLKSGKYNEEKVDFDDEFDEIEDSQDEDWYSVERIAKKTGYSANDSDFESGKKKGAWRIPSDRKEKAEEIIEEDRYYLENLED